MTPDSHLHYVYGVVHADFSAVRAPAGMDGSRVEVLTRGALSALTSRVPASEYSPDTVEQRSGDVEWLSPRAMTHDRVLTWAQEHGGVIPLPMFSLWGSEDSVRRMLDEQASRLAVVFERVANADEFGLRVHRREAVLRDALPDLDAGIGALQSAARAASPGQRYLLERKLADASKAALRSVSQGMAKEVWEALRPIAREAMARPVIPPAAGTAETTMVLNGAFLVDRARVDEFRKAVTALIERYESRGLAFDFTGPWPPYNFAG